MRLWLTVLAALAVATMLAAGAGARAQGAREGLSALARLGPDGVRLLPGRGGLVLTMELTRPVPWRVFVLDDPRRLVLDFSELDWSGLDAPALAARSDAILTARAGLLRPGWSRLVLELSAPYAVRSAAMERGAGEAVTVRLRLEETSPEDFASAAGVPPSALFSLPDFPGNPANPPARQRQAGDRPLVVVLDPGHGGIDPGAEREGLREADVVLRFARELKELLLRSGEFRVVLTREGDVFVPLETRVTLARRADADVFISLHADALGNGRASGAAVYTLSEEASDLASEKLAERHDRGDLLAGVDLAGQSDSVALVLMDLVRRETRPRSERLAEALIEGIYAATGATRKNPRLSAAFSVLKAPDIPSVLIELGFLSSPRDRARLADPAWRRAVAEGIRDALSYWAIEDAAEAARLRR